jgi:hypothetical protein
LTVFIPRFFKMLERDTVQLQNIHSLLMIQEEMSIRTDIVSVSFSFTIYLSDMPTVRNICTFHSGNGSRHYLVENVVRSLQSLLGDDTSLLQQIWKPKALDKCVPFLEILLHLLHSKVSHTLKLHFYVNKVL